MLGEGGGCIGPGCGSSGGSTPPSWLKSQAAWAKYLGDGGGCIGPGCLSSAPALTTRPGAVTKGIGCNPDPMDRRDWTFEEGVQRLKLTIASKKKPSLSRIHLWDALPEWSIVDDQGPWNTCTACVVTTALEYSRIRSQLPTRQLSRLFLYNTTRFLLRQPGDSGADLRTTIKAAQGFGIPPEEFWPYDPQAFLFASPDALTCEMARSVKPAGYCRLDDGSATGPALVNRLKCVLSSQMPLACGIPVHRSMVRCGEDNGYVIPLPSRGMADSDSLTGGHAVLIAGYDDGAEWDDMGRTRKGAFIVRNSWGRSWGDKGYAFLPYSYVEEGLVIDLWLVV